jgi:transcriptional regulator with XRE-family HTH domain
VDRRSTAQLHTASDFFSRQLAANLLSRRTASAGEVPRRAANMVHEAPLIDDLKTRRQSLGWSVKEVGERCGIDEKSLSEWERGVASPRLDAALLWAATLGLNFTLVPVESEIRRGLKVDWDKRRVTVDAKPVRLTPMEWKALERLAWAPGELVTHQALFQHLYGVERDYRAQSTAVRVLITKLRRLLPLQIAAHWGKGYVVNGLDSSLPRAASADDGSATAKPEPAKTQRERVTPTLGGAPQDPPPFRHECTETSESEMQRVADPSPRHSPCRAEELGVIERFLAERGATRCPDVSTIQQSPLPTLVWDKLKRKWVRPPAAGPEA